MPPSLAHLRRHRDAIAELVAALDDTTLAELHRRAQHPAADGFGAGASGAAVMGGGVSRPVESIITSLAGGRLERVGPDGTRQPATPDTWRPPFDPTGQALEEMFALLAEMAGVGAQANARRRYVLSVHDSAIRRQSSQGGVCAACQRDVIGTENDRIKAGYCPACYTAWIRAERPDRLRFERERRAGRAS